MFELNISEIEGDLIEFRCGCQVSFNTNRRPSLDWLCHKHMDDNGNVRIPGLEN